MHSSRFISERITNFSLHICFHSFIKPHPLTINRLNISDILPKFSLQILIIEIFWRCIPLRIGFIVKLFDSHWSLLYIKLLIKPLFSRNKLQNWAFNYDVNIVNVVAIFPRNPFWRRYYLSQVVYFREMVHLNVDN